MADSLFAEGASVTSRGHPPSLYHYTNASGLRGILESKSIWATDAEFLNDAKEMQFGRNDLYEALIRYAEEITARHQSSDDEARSSRVTIVQSAASHLKPGGMFASKQYFFAYVSCFCEESDLLSQWRGYGAESGFAIGFDPNALKRARLDGGYEIRLVRVRYGEPAIQEMIDHVISDVAPHPAGHPGTYGYYQAANLVIPALASIKHDAFREEKEWRLLVVTDATRIQFRISRLGFVPYVTLSLDDDTVKEIVIGPGSHSELRARGVERLLHSAGLENVMVRLSEAPFRS